MSEIFDVIVVGAGPAGAATAIACRRNKLRTLILETRPRTGELPGESLHPGMETLFRTLEVDAAVDQAGFLRYPGRIVRSDAQSSFEPFGSDHRGQWLGYQADRVRLNDILLRQAVASGAHILRVDAGVHAVVRNQRVEGIVTNSRTFTSRFVVDAAGSGQWLARQLGLRPTRVSPTLIAEFGWVKPSEERKGLNVPEFRIDGATWEWIAPINSKRHAWVRLDLMNRGLSRKLDPPSILSECSPLGRASARDVTWKIARPCAGPNYFMVGDAAWVLDPASSHGVFKAVISGLVAAEAIANSLRGAADAEQQQLGYTAWAETWFCTDAAALLSSYSASPDPATWLSTASELVRKIATSPAVQAFSTSRTTV
jgi:flavin-dependent dehydrogenase